MGDQTNWQRLYDIANRRMSELGLTRNALNKNGGPTSSWFWALQSRHGRPSARMARSLEQLDVALGWPVGTSYRLARDPFVPGSPAALDEEHRLIYGDESTTIPGAAPALDPEEQKIRDFATLIMGMLRALPPDQRDYMMARILQTAEIG